MATAYNPSVAKVEMRYTWDGEEVENTLYFQLQAPIGVGGLVLLTGNLYTWWDANIRPLQSASVQLREIYARSMAGLIAPEYTWTTNLPASGENIEASLPNNVSLAISFRTGLTGRSSRGRNYIIGLTEPMVAQNTVTPGVVSAYVAAYSQLTPAGGIFEDISWVVYSQYSGGVLRPTGQAVAVLSVVVVDDTVDSQRRRLPGRGQ